MSLKKTHCWCLHFWVSSLPHCQNHQFTYLCWINRFGYLNQHVLFIKLKFLSKNVEILLMIFLLTGGSYYIHISCSKFSYRSYRCILVNYVAPIFRYFANSKDFSILKFSKKLLMIPYEKQVIISNLPLVLLNSCVMSFVKSNIFSLIQVFCRTFE